MGRYRADPVTGPTPGALARNHRCAVDRPFPRIDATLARVLLPGRVRCQERQIQTATIANGRVAGLCEGDVRRPASSGCRVIFPAYAALLRLPRLNPTHIRVKTTTGFLFPSSSISLPRTGWVRQLWTSLRAEKNLVS